MREEWIKFEKDTLEKSKILIAAARLGISHGDAILAFLRLYCWADKETADGFVPQMSPAIGDGIARQKGFIAAMAEQSEPWITILPDGIRFNNWHEHNGKSAKKRAQEVKKKRLQRDGGPDGGGKNVPSSAGQEREKCPVSNGTPSIIDKDINTTTTNIGDSAGDSLMARMAANYYGFPESWRDPALLAAFGRWLAYRNGLRPIKTGQIEAWVAQCLRLKSPERAVIAIDHTIGVGVWDLEEPKNMTPPDGAERPANAPAPRYRSASELAADMVEVPV